MFPHRLTSERVPSHINFMKIEEKIITLKDGRSAVLRSGQVTDALQLNTCFDKIKTQTKFIAVSPEDKTSLEEQEERIERYLNSDTEVLLIAIVDGEVAGSCTFGNRKSTKRTKHRASLGIALEDSYTNAGLGTEMIRYAIEICKKMGFERFELGYIEGNNRARKVYTRLGFVETGRIPQCMKYNDGTYADEILMSMNLL